MPYIVNSHSRELTAASGCILSLAKFYFVIAAVNFVMLVYFVIWY